MFSFFKGRSVGVQAKIEALRKGVIKQRIDVIKLNLDDGKTGVGLKIVARSFLSYQSLPISLNEKQARELSKQILKALGDENDSISS